MQQQEDSFVKYTCGWFWRIYYLHLSLHGTIVNFSAGSTRSPAFSANTIKRLLQMLIPGMNVRGIFLWKSYYILVMRSDWFDLSRWTIPVHKLTQETRNTDIQSKARTNHFPYQRVSKPARRGSGMICNIRRMLYMRMWLNKFVYNIIWVEV